MQARVQEQNGRSKERKPRKDKKYFLSEFQEKLLIDRYDGRTETINALMVYFPDVPRQRVLSWAKELGITHKRPWSEAEVTYLKTYFHRYSLERIAQRLGRTSKAVDFKARTLGLFEEMYEGYSIPDLTIGFGTSDTTIRRWIQRGWIVPRRKHVTETNNQWYFSEKAVREFILKHPREINQYRCDLLWVLEMATGGLGVLAAS